MKRPLTAQRRFITRSPRETQILAGRLARFLKTGDVVLLQSNLGGGKTTFSQGLLAGLGVKSPVLSPTFVLAQTFPGRLPIHHLDFYRLTSRDLLLMGVQDYLNGVGEIEKGVVVMEWADRGRNLWPREHIQVNFRLRKEAGEREIAIRGVGRRFVSIIQTL